MADTPEVNAGTLTLVEALHRAATVAPQAKISRLRFVDASFGMTHAPTTSAGDPSAMSAVVEVSREDRTLHSLVKYSITLAANNPNLPRRIDMVASMRISYKLSEELVADETAIEAFGKINGIYNSWPYWREFVQTSLIRMELPPYYLPLLMAEGAAKAAGYELPPMPKGEVGNAQSTAPP